MFIMFDASLGFNDIYKFGESLEDAINNIKKIKNVVYKNQNNIMKVKFSKLIEFYFVNSKGCTSLIESGFVEVKDKEKYDMLRGECEDH